MNTSRNYNLQTICNTKKNQFLTKVKDVPSTHKDNNSIFITDILHSCHGNLKSTVQINFLVDYEWLNEMYEATGNEKIPLLILHGEDSTHLRSQSFTSLMADLHHSLIRGVLIQSCSAGAKNFAKNVFFHVQ